ncbi:beta-galactosidase [Kineococcus radiotolerans]|uniref:beta-galactosidase n=1 Tax=Kineococcus radiotolerans TaxID=131568 RepID=A0A7W4TQX0_KINRA|nr:beta-galactosidase [Kineococcus radiotolerans]MBB2903399.1 beta-galactosidase [Kineococcus radiotolerans]
MYTHPERIRFGAAYYHEYQPAYQTSPKLEEDLDLMAQARFTVIRVGESVWSTWEPEEGTFDLDWLQPVLDGAHARGIDVVLGTPTYAVPPWLARLYPEITGESATGQRMGWGQRQEVDYTHPAFRFHAERVIRAIVARYAEHPAVVGFQVDNEPGMQLFHNHGVFQRFVDSLRRTYGDVETLNREWGLVYWSHRLATWADLWTPDGNVQPQYDLAWRRFQAEQTTGFIAWQADIVREYSREDQFVTTCISYDRPAVEDDAVTRRLDVTAGNPYYTMQDGLQLPAPEVEVQGWTTNGVWALYQSADRMWSSKQANYLVTETDAQAIGMPWVNRPGYDGQWKQAGWALVARGADMVEYWHWHTLHFGAETYWGGVLPHSGRPGRVYAEIAELGAQFEAAGPLVTGLRPHHDVTFLYSQDSKWSMQEAPPLATADGGPDHDAYKTLTGPFHRGAFDAGAQSRILHVGQVPVHESDLTAFVAENPVLVAVAVYVTSDDLLRFLNRYVDAGGHLLLGPRTAYADLENRARHDVQPALLSEAAGVRYDEFSNLLRPVAVAGLAEGARATHWVDGLQAGEGTEVLATYQDAHFGRWPAVTTRASGAGRVTVVGTVPNPAMAEAVFRGVLPDLDVAWRGTSGTVTATSATARDGSTVRFLTNWSLQPATVTLPAAVRDVITGVDVAAGATLELGPSDVRVLVQV